MAVCTLKKKSLAACYYSMYRSTGIYFKQSQFCSRERIAALVTTIFSHQHDSDKVVVPVNTKRDGTVTNIWPCLEPINLSDFAGAPFIFYINGDFPHQRFWEKLALYISMSIAPQS